MTSPYTNHHSRLLPYLKQNALLHEEDGLPASQMPSPTPGTAANAYYFGHPEWMAGWLKYVHRYPELRERWHTVSGPWDGRVIIDIGCGPGNLFANLGGHPAELIGIDIAKGSLHMAEKVGYVPLLADAHDLPLRSEVADIVAVNGSIHHVEDMEAVMRECARLVKPGGFLIIDHDPQKSAWDFRGIGKLLWKLRRPLYRLMKRGGHRSEENEGEWAYRSELHHRPGDGLSEPLFRQTLEPLGFKVSVYPHNHKVGAEVVTGSMGKQPRQIRIGQLLSGIRSDSPEGALTLMCVAEKAA